MIQRAFLTVHETIKQIAFGSLFSFVSIVHYLCQGYHLFVVVVSVGNTYCGGSIQNRNTISQNQFDFMTDGYIIDHNHTTREPLKPCPSDRGLSFVGYCGWTSDSGQADTDRFKRFNLSLSLHSDCLIE